MYNRAGKLLSANQLKDGDWEKTPNAVEIIETERQRKPTEKEIENLRTDWQRIYDLMDERKAPPREIEQARLMYQTIERDLSKGRG